MSEPKDPWDDTGFEPDERDDSFLASPKQTPKRLEVDATKPEPLPAVPPAAAVPPPPRYEPPVKERKRGALYWIAGIAGVLFVCALGGFAVWFLFGERSAEDELIYSDDPVPAEVPAPTQDTAVATLDTLALTTDDAPVEEVTPAANQATESAPAVSRTDAPASTVKPRTMTEQSKPPVQKQQAKPPVVKSTALDNAPAQQPRSTPTPAAKVSSSTLGGSSMKTAQPPKTAAQPMYVVQVFSSPSRDDADEWLQSLRDKKVPNGYIVEQPIKGRPWYRVRFGEFATRQDAEAAAIRYGITQPWIARVR